MRLGTGPWQRHCCNWCTLVCTNLSLELINAVPQPFRLIAHIHRLGSVTIRLVTSVLDAIEGPVLDRLLALGKGV